MSQERFADQENNLLLSREEIEKIVDDLGVKEGDNTLYLEYTDDKGDKRTVHWMKFKKIMTAKGPVPIEDYILDTKKELGL